VSTLPDLSPGLPGHAQELDAAQAAISALPGLSPGLPGHAEEIAGPPGALDGMACLVPEPGQPPVPGA
jgi:hypothetical protein